MANKYLLTVEPRDILGKKSGRLRHQGWVLGNISIPGSKSVAIKINSRKFDDLYQEVGESSLLYLQVGEEKSPRPVLIDELQKHTVSDQLLHVSFRQVSLKEKVVTEVPIEVEGEVDVDDATLVLVRDSIEISALPTDLPDKFIIDVSILTEVGQSISVADLKFDKSKVELVLSEDQDPTQMPVAVVQQIKEEVEEVEEVKTGDEGKSESEDKGASDGDGEKESGGETQKEGEADKSGDDQKYGD